MVHCCGPCYLSNEVNNWRVKGEELTEIVSWPDFFALGGQVSPAVLRTLILISMNTFDEHMLFIVVSVDILTLIKLELKL